MDNIISRISKHYEFDNEKTFLNNNKYEIFDYSFENIIKKRDNIFFIDGGNQEVLSSNTYSVSFNKLSSTNFLDIKIGMNVKKFWTTVILGKDMKYEVETDELILSFDAYDKTLTEEGNRVTPSKLSNVARKIAELIYAKEISDKNKDSIIVLDGILLANITGVKKYFDELYSSAKLNNNIICGLAKNSNLVTTNGKSLPDVLDSMHSGAWLCKIAKSKIAEHNAIIYLVKLHERSNYVFRFEIQREHEDKANEIIGALANNSRDPVFLGYPYGLVLADDMARVTNSEAEYYRTKIISKMKKNIKVNAHSILDNIKF